MADSSIRAGRGFWSDQSWRPLYRAGATAATFTVVLYVVAMLMYIVTPAPPLSTSGAATLDYVAAQRGGYIIRQLLWLAPSLLLIIVVLALAVALYPLSKSFAMIAGVIAISS